MHIGALGGSKFSGGEQKQKNNIILTVWQGHIEHVCQISKAYYLNSSSVKIVLVVRFKSELYGVAPQTLILNK